MNIRIFLSAMMLLTCLSCQKKQPPIDPSKVGISFLQPKPNQFFNKGDEVLIKANITYPGDLRGYYKVNVTDTAGNALLWATEKKAQGEQFFVEETWTDTLSKYTVIRLGIQIFVDNNSVAEKSILIHSVP